jgi:hypothetical protein
MRARSVPLGSMFGWIPATFRMVFGHFGAMVIAALVTLLVVVVCMGPVMYWELTAMMPQLASPGVTQAPQLGASFWIAYVVSLVVATLVMTPIMAGWMRMCHSADRGQQVSPMQVLAPFRDPSSWGRLLGFVLMMALVFAVFGLLMFVLFGGVFKGLLALSAAQQLALASHTAPPQPDMALIGGMLLMYVIALPTFAVLQLIYFVGMSEVAVQQTSPVAALGEAAGGVLRNLVKLLVFGFCLAMGAFIVMMIVMVVLVLVIGLVGFLSPVVAAIFGALVYLAFLLVMYPLMFASNYLVWKDMLGDTSPPALTL